jgi:single-stranded-DNA-specific exonuclease
VGTVADVVRLDDNNRILVQMGLERIRNGHAFPGIDALALAASRDPRKLSTSDIGFGIGPRVNAAGRLADMSTGIECLLTDSVAVAEDYARQLNTLNNERKAIEKDMSIEASNELVTRVTDDRYTVTLTGEKWHAGVVGIVAGRIKERVWRPTFAMAQEEDGQYKGSGRSIPGFHLRDALDLIDRRHPGLLVKFGGHAMAAGLTLREGGLEEFEQAFEAVAHELINPEILNQEVSVDGELPVQQMTLETIEAIKEEVWGQGFPEPVFLDTFEVLEARMIGKDHEHLKMTLQKDGVAFDAVHFRYQGTLPNHRVKALYKLDANTWKGKTKLQMLVDSFV